MQKLDGFIYSMFTVLARHKTKVLHRK